MIRAALLASLSAILGGAIALVARKRPGVLERTRTFAFAAAASVVAFHLLPEVLPAKGLVALLWMGVGFTLPWLLEAGARLLGPGFLRARGFAGLRVAAEVGFVALLFHSVIEGIALVAALAQPRGQLDLEIALVAHHAPLTAAVVLPFLELRGPRTVARRALVVGACGVGGVLLSRFLPGFEQGGALTIAIAVTAGALLHVVADEIRLQRFASPWERAADLGACAAGLLVAGVGAVLHIRGEGRAGPLLEFTRVFTGTALASAPAVLFGSVAGALLALRTRFFRWDALLLALVLLGPLPAVALGALAVLLHLPVAPAFAPAGPPRGVLAELLAAVRERAPPMLALLVVAAGLEVSTPVFPAHLLPAGALVIGLGLCARLDEAGAIVVGAVLVRKGLDPGLAVALLALGPFTRLAVLRALAVKGRGAAAAAVAVLAAAAFGLGRLLSISGVLAADPPAAAAALEGVRAPLLTQAAASPAGAASAAVLVAIALATLWSAGVRGWFAPLRHGPKVA